MVRVSSMSDFVWILIVIFTSVNESVTFTVRGSSKDPYYYQQKRPNIKVNSSFHKKTVERPLHIGSYNVQTLGRKKFENDQLMIILEKVVHRYDLILITELMTNDQYLIQRFLNDVNRFAPENVTYNLVMNNETVHVEYYAFLYRINKLRLIKTDSYRDPNKFYRSPFFALFESPTLRDMNYFGVIGHHVKPDKAVQEIDALADVYDFMSDKHNIEDILLMGDFNAQCKYVSEDKWIDIALWTRPDFTWPIGHNVDTTTNYKSCALDRFVYAGENMNSGVIMSSAKPLHLEEEFGISLEEARALSDHKPIEIKIRGRMTSTAEQHLTSESCFSIRDTNIANANKSLIMKEAEKVHYRIRSSQPGVLFMSNETRNMDETVKALKKLRSSLPSALTEEQLEAILYKLENGALHDKSSYADEQTVLYKTKYTLLRDYVIVTICKTCTIN